VSQCPSCGEEVRGRYCPQCGQSHAEVRVPFGKWLRDYIDDTFHLDSKLVRSLAMLVRQPGALTLAYIEGQRSAYVRPFRLYLAASFLYFLVLSLAPARSVIEVRVTSDTVSVKRSVEDAAQGGTASPRPRPDVPLLKEDSHFKRQLNRFVEKGPQAVRDQVRSGIARTMPKAMFVLVPVFALLLKLLFRRAGRFYAEHFLFALHFHAFAFFVLAFFLALPLGDMSWLTQVLIAGYLFLALRRVYGQPRLRTALKVGLLWGGYGFILLASIVGGLMVSLYFAE
jgi:hypothetical protein